jgi:hypothetical protein
MAVMSRRMRIAAAQYRSGCRNIRKAVLLRVTNSTHRPFDPGRYAARVWLLLSAESSGSGVLAGARFVQRVNTSGGVGPTGPRPTVGTERIVEYTAD